MDVDNLRSLLKKYGLKPNSTYGQNFLVDEEVLDKIVDVAEISSKDAILEIGPGIGNLTRRLCEKAGFVLSIEKDPKFQPILHTIKKDYRKNFRFEIADALEFNFQSVLIPELVEGPKQTSSKIYPSTGSGNKFYKQETYKVVANIPYYITGKILEMFFAAKFKPASITILTQKEVGERVVAKPGDLSVLAISVQIFGEPKIIRTVSRNSFYPAPKVDSVILHIDLSQPSKYQITDQKKFFKIVKACFAGKRKQIHNTLVNNLKLNREQAIDALSSLHIDPRSRPQELAIGEWVALSEKLF